MPFPALCLLLLLQQAGRGVHVASIYLIELLGIWEKLVLGVSGEERESGRNGSVCVL